MTTILRPICEDDLAAAAALIRRVFDRFEGPDYPTEGIDTFYRIIDPEAMSKRLHSGQMQAWGAFRGSELVGVLASRDQNHISLLFVEAAYHRQGIARALFDTFCAFIRPDATIHRITVNSSPFAVEAYIRLGFTPTSVEQTAEGIRFTPMQYLL